jgi:heme-degrading monooxygenase HmoA
MILELAKLDIKATELASFENALPNAKAVISQAKGFVSIEFKKCIETAGKYVLLIHWETLEDHTVGFRESDLFTQWRAIIGPFFNSPPFVEHYENI